MDKLGINLLNHHENTALIVRNEENESKIVSYKNLLKSVFQSQFFIEQYEEITKGSTIGIYAEKSFVLVTLTLAILETGHSFYYITKDDFEQLDRLNIKYFFSTTELDVGKRLELKKTLMLCDTSIYFYEYKSAIINIDDNQVCYKISTSGTTAKKKLIHVSYNSINANIRSFAEIFKLGQNDVILSASPITFDVFILDLFFALYSGAAILFIPDNLRFDVSIYSKDTKEAITFVQITPTIFKQYGLENIQCKILDAQSSLKYLLLGGEEFPSTKEVLHWQDWESESRKRIFNIYGITEMSCWALIHEVTKNDLEFGKVPLGEPLDQDTIVAYNPYNTKSNVEELMLLTPSRINFFDKTNKSANKNSSTNAYFAYTTNDLVKKINGKTYWYGRSNDVVKRFGERVNLKEIEDLASEIIEPVACVMIKKRIVLFYQSSNSDISQLLTNHLRLKLSKSHCPDEIKRIDFLPTCDHGKVSKNKLKELYKSILKEDSIKQNAEEIFLEAINQMFNLRLEKPATDEMDSDEPDGKRMRYDIDSTFQQIGGSSFDALRVVMQIEDKLSTSNALLPKLLDNHSTIKEVFHYLKNLNVPHKNGDVTDRPLNSTTKNNSISLKVLKKFNLEKCVDSTPSLITLNDASYIVVGSHSGKLITIKADNLDVVSTVKLNDRIECEAVRFRDFVIIGCYDGYLYCVDVLNETEVKRIKFAYKSGGMIKSKPLVIGSELVIFGNYNYEENLKCIFVDENFKVTVKWGKMLGSSGIIASILQLDSATCIVCTLDGVIERLKIVDGETVWNKKYEYPIFSNPQRIEKLDALVFAEVMGTVHCLDSDGNELWNFSSGGHIFSSFIHNPLNETVKIIFGCHDHKLRCLNCSENTVSANWETKLQSQIYATPNRMKNFIVSCSTNGHVNLIDSLTGEIKNSIKLPGEVFSSCLVVDDKIFIGCRDNFVYCLSIK